MGKWQEIHSKQFLLQETESTQQAIQTYVSLAIDREMENVAPCSIVQTLNLHDLKTTIHYLYNTKPYRKNCSICNVKYNASLGTNTNIHIRTGQMMALLSFYYAESKTLYLQHILCFTGKYIKLMLGRLIQGYIVEN